MTRNGPIKYPRTSHLPWSPGATEDDKVLDDLSVLKSSPLVVTEKMDGENTSLYGPPTFAMHARSLDSRHHESRSWVKNLHAAILHRIPHGWRICGENLYARHSIAYESLPSYFLVFSVWNENNHCLSWSENESFCHDLDLTTVPVLARGRWDAIQAEELPESLDNWHPQKMEGIVIRTEAGFALGEFPTRIAKWVRTNHVQTDTHWMHQEVVPNSLIK